jgi:hypothetical protein
MIYYCTRLKQTQGEEREAIEKEMMEQPELQKILEELVETSGEDIVTVNINSIIFDKK